MKKKTIILVITMFFGVSVFSQNKEKIDTTQKQKVYTFTLTEQGLSMLFFCLDNSNAPHATYVKPLYEALITQIRQNSGDTTKPQPIPNYSKPKQ